MDSGAAKKLEKDRAGAIVRSVGWLSETPASFQNLVLARCDLLHFVDAGAVYAAGDDPGGIFGVAAGTLELHLPWRGARTTLSHLAGPGIWVGEGAAMTGNVRRIATVARPACTLLRLPRADMNLMIRDDPRVLQHFSALVSRNLNLAIDIINALKRDDAAERLAATLLNHVDDASAQRWTVRASQSDLAAIAGLARSSVNAALGELERRGLLARRYAALELMDVPALRRFTEGGWDEISAAGELA